MRLGLRSAWEVELVSAEVGNTGVTTDGEEETLYVGCVECVC